MSKIAISLPELSCSEVETRVFFDIFNRKYGKGDTIKGVSWKISKGHFPVMERTSSIDEVKRIDTKFYPVAIPKKEDHYITDDLLNDLVVSQQEQVPKAFTVVKPTARYPTLAAQNNEDIAAAQILLEMKGGSKKRKTMN
jgi:hypothetical protein